MSRIVVVPGIGGSGEAHWQTLWEASDPRFVRLEPSNWDAPDLEDWLAALDRAVAASSEPPVLVAHSLGCLLLAHWWGRGAGTARGAVLVATPDPDGPAFPVAEAASFRDPPEAKAPFPVLMIASADDPYGTPAHAAARARTWGARLIDIGAAGHINAASGLGDWPRGKTLLSDFLASLQTPAAP